MLFPALRGKNFGYIHLNTEARHWLCEQKYAEQLNPLLDPEICSRFIQDTHVKYGLDFSYGGWLEDRSDLWRGKRADADRLVVTWVHAFNEVDFIEHAAEDCPLLQARVCPSTSSRDTVRPSSPRWEVSRRISDGERTERKRCGLIHAFGQAAFIFYRLY